MNILIVYLGRKGGGAHYTYELVNELSKKTNVSLLVSKQAENIKSYESLNISLNTINTFNGMFSFILSSFKLPFIKNKIKKIILDEKIDIVISTMTHVWNGFIFTPNFMMKIPYILTIHDAVPHSGEGNFILNLLNNKDIKNANAYIALTEHVKNQFINIYGDKKDICILPLGSFNFKSGEIKSWCGVRPLRILFFGRIHEYKGIDLLLDSMIILQEKYDLELSIYGQGDLSDYVDKIDVIKKINIENRWIGDSEVGDILQAHDVCVIPYKDASQSGVIPVAQSAGLPTIVNPVDGLIEQIEKDKTSLVTDRVDSVSLALSIEKIIKNPELVNKLSIGSLEYASGKLSWVPIVNKLITYSKETLNSSDRS
ncbi:glycosyltransferase family 4 protein [Yersinia pseudotuberculosis]|uniref:glycosyltransferase family 4 protein n=1 Tax=Yersinia pseudotuberculosis TaxID=633 RepID=UPI0003D5D01A|nr:glycosyltransferase family 4 protein [Yersinia pseudotuberculosis]AJJ70834.1 glycosyl transferases group 1 family protein [Yersinia pseudotuberculosis]GAE11628.1 putative glycosyltransferase [Yersinia pseudotuberculosis NBRC 105692]CNK19594.1 group 1 glycosyl transferase [Yersinia pseudotuberculosis]VEG88517.1 group 1 glycosyl transferase [Yersinia pseudotuberculosis]